MSFCRHSFDVVRQQQEICGLGLSSRPSKEACLEFGCVLLLPWQDKVTTRPAKCVNVVFELYKNLSEQCASATNAICTGVTFPLKSRWKCSLLDQAMFPLQLSGCASGSSKSC